MYEVIKLSYFLQKFGKHPLICLMFFLPMSFLCRIDDIEDNSRLRRGTPVAHLIYGVPTTLNSANYMYFLGLQKLLQLGKPECAQVSSKSILTVAAVTICVFCDISPLLNEVYASAKSN